MSGPRDQVVFELAALMREAFADVAVAAYQAPGLGQSQEQMLAVVLPAAEPFVQTFMRRVVVHDA